MKLLFLLLTTGALSGCTGYEKTVDSRSVGLRGEVDPLGGGSGKVVYTVHYR